MVKKDTKDNKITKELPVISFDTQEDWKSWLEENFTSSGLWLKMAKKQTGIKSVNYQESLEIALCYGWIDGQKKAFDEIFWLQKFTPRGNKSIWSKVNKDKCEKLIEDGKMMPSGFKAIETAKENGLWENAYESQSKIAIPEDLQIELDKNPESKKFFESLDSTNRYAILFRLQTAKKPETRAKRLELYLDMLKKGEKIYPKT